MDFKKLILVLFLVALGCVARAQNLRGILLDQSSGEPMAAVPINLLMVEGKSIRQVTDAKGNFFFQHLPPGRYSLCVIPLAKKDTTFSAIDLPRDSVVELKYYIYCQYDGWNNKRSCPICKKHDKVIPVRYGLPVYAPENKHPNEDEFYDAGCEITYCDPHWYCKRNKIRF